MQRSATEIAPDDIVQAAKAYMAQARAECTHRAYGQAWALFGGWCKEHGREPCPATAATMTAWMAALARGDDGKTRSRASNNLYLSAVVAQRMAGYPFVVTLQRSKSLQADAVTVVIPGTDMPRACYWHRGVGRSREGRGGPISLPRRRSGRGSTD